MSSLEIFIQILLGVLYLSAIILPIVAGILFIRKKKIIQLVSPEGIIGSYWKGIANNGNTYTSENGVLWVPYEPKGVEHKTFDGFVSTEFVKNIKVTRPFLVPAILSFVLSIAIAVFGIVSNCCMLGVL